MGRCCLIGHRRKLRHQVRHDWRSNGYGLPRLRRQIVNGQGVRVHLKVVGTSKNLSQRMVAMAMFLTAVKLVIEVGDGQV